MHDLPHPSGHEHGHYVFRTYLVGQRNGCRQNVSEGAEPSDGRAAFSITTGKGIGSTRTASRLRLTTRIVSAKRFTLRTFILKKECSAMIVTLHRTITAMEKFTASRAPPSKSIAWIATARFEGKPPS